MLIVPIPIQQTWHHPGNPIRPGVLLKVKAGRKLCPSLFEPGRSLLPFSTSSSIIWQSWRPYGITNTVKRQAEKIKNMINMMISSESPLLLLSNSGIPLLRNARIREASGKLYQTRFGHLVHRKLEDVCLLMLGKPEHIHCKLPYVKSNTPT